MTEVHEVFYELTVANDDGQTFSLSLPEDTICAFEDFQSGDSYRQVRELWGPAHAFEGFCLHTGDIDQIASFETLH